MYKEFLLSHHRSYPLMRAEDYIKLIYQSEYGAHSKVDALKALTFIEKECLQLSGGKNVSLCEDISPTLSRVNLLPYSKEHFSLPLLVGFFARSYEEGNEENLFEKLEEFCLLCESKSLNLAPFAVRNLVNKYKLKPCALSHSLTYTKNYFPHYRVIKKDYADILRLFGAIEGNLDKGTLLVAIDGDSASGKSRYGKVIKDFYGQRCNLFHTDDFFLPKERKTQERLSQLGGNIDYEALSLLIKDILRGEEVSFTPFDCSSQSYKNKITVKPAQINIIEGVYSAHSSLRKYYNIIADFNIKCCEQQRRILSRDGWERLADYNKLWLPLEKAYLKDLRENNRHLLTFAF